MAPPLRGLMCYPQEVIHKHIYIDEEARILPEYVAVTLECCCSHLKGGRRGGIHHLRTISIPMRPCCRMAVQCSICEVHDHLICCTEQSQRVLPYDWKCDE